MVNIYHYIAEKNNTRVEGFISGENEVAAKRELARARLQKVRLKLCVIQEDEEVLKTSKKIEPPKPLVACVQKVLISKGTVNQALEHIGFLLESGVPILKAFMLVAKLSRSALLRRAFTETAIRLASGESLTKVMKEQLPFIDPISLNLIAVGEINGTLEHMFGYAATLRKDQKQVQTDMLMAMMYPAMVSVIAGAIVTFLVKVIFPKILKMLVNRGAELPAITQQALASIDFLENYGIYILIAPFAWIALMKILRRDARLGYLIDFFALRIPVMGKMRIAGVNAVWTRSLGMLMGSGVQVVQSLYMCSNTVSNLYVRKQFDWVSDLVKQGHSLSMGARVTALNKVCPMAEAMLKIGEGTGRIDENLYQVSDYYKADLKIRIKILSTFLELGVILSVAAFIGFIYIGFFMGIMSLSRR